MRPGPALNLENLAAVYRPATVPTNPPATMFVGASIPASMKIDLEALHILQAIYGERLIVTCGIVSRRLFIILLCPDGVSVEDFWGDAEDLRTDISSTLRIFPCMARKGYLELCLCLGGDEDAADAISLSKSEAREGATMH